MKVGNNEPCPCGSGRKFKKCHKGVIATFKSERFIVSAKQDGLTYKLFSIRFHQNKKNGTAAIQIYFPYSLKTNGLLSMITFPANVKRMDKLSMTAGGKVTTKGVKYSHWADGGVHFSQDGVIYTTHRKQSFPLHDSVGHLFSVQAKGFHGFKTKTDAKKTTSKEFDVDIDLGAKTTDSVKVTGWWYDARVMHVYGNHVPSIYSFTGSDGIGYTCFALEAPPQHILSGKVLLLCFRREPFMTKERGTHLLFLGGFDGGDVWKDITQDFHFLGLKYPVRNFKKMLTELPSVDFQEPIIAGKP